MEKDSLEMFTYKHDNIVKLANYNKYPTYFPKTTASFTAEKLDYDILSKFTLSAEYNYMNLKHEPQLFSLVKFGYIIFRYCAVGEISAKLNEFIKILRHVSCVIPIFTVTPNLINLQQLDFIECDLVEIYGIDILQNLKTLNLNQNRITCLSDDFYTLKNLEVFNARGNRLSCISQKIMNMRKLQRILIDENMITDIPERICTLPNLKELTVSYNKLDIFPIGLEKISSKYHGYYRNPIIMHAFDVGFGNKTIEYSNYKHTVKYVEKYFPIEFGFDQEIMQTLLLWIYVVSLR